jgi:glycosyltransferase involved in cell wall biosynthesis
MRILQVNKYYFIKGGVDSVFFNTMQLLKEHGHDVIPFSIHHQKNLGFSDYFVRSPEIREQSFIKKILSILKFFYNKNAARQIEKLILKEKPDVAHLHNIFNGISLSILPVLKKYRIPVVITMHDTRFICPSSYFKLRGKLCENCKKRFFLNCMFHKCYQDNLFNSVMTGLEMMHKNYLFNYNRYINKYIFVSHRYLEFHSNIHQYFKEKGTVLYNFLPDGDKVIPNHKQGNYLFYYGRLTPEKGIQTLVEAMSDFPDLTLKIAGTGPLSEQLKQSAGKNIEFLGFITGKELFDNLKKSSFVIVPSEWQENNPLTIIESYFYGKPVIASSIGGIPEIVRNGETGFIFEPFSKKSLSDTIQKAIGISDVEYETMSKNAWRFAMTHFDAETHYNRLIQIYTDVINENI